MVSTGRICCLILFREPGIFRSLFSGLQHRGLQQDYIMLLQYRVMNQSSRAWGEFSFYRTSDNSCRITCRPVDGSNAETWVMYRISGSVTRDMNMLILADSGRYFFLWSYNLAVLMGRAIWPALKQKSESRSLLMLFLISSIAIAAFYGAGLMWGRQTNLAIAEYWRWWVVHLWVEGFFEVFAAVVVAFLFVRLQILKAATATTAVLFSTIVFFRRYSRNLPSSVFHRNSNISNGSRCNIQRS